jgi:hypothetical protein
MRDQRWQPRSKHIESEPDLLGLAMALCMLVTVYAALHWWDAHIQTLMVVPDTGSSVQTAAAPEAEDEAAVGILNPP